MLLIKNANYYLLSVYGSTKVELNFYNSFIQYATVSIYCHLNQKIHTEIFIYPIFT